MKEPLSVSTVKTLLDNAVVTFPHDACQTCECFLGYVAQLSTESDEPGKELLEGYQPRRENVHPCLGCDPCPPGEHYAQYLREHRKG